MNTKRMSQQGGFAIVIVLLVSSVILISVVVTASLTALGSRVSASDERTSYQALLAAESGINALAPRAEEEEYRGRLDETIFNAWLASSGVGALTFDNGNATQITVDNVNPPYTPTVDVYQVTFRSESNVSGDRGRKIVLQDYTLTQPPRPNVGVPAALTSWPTVSVGGNAAITGFNGNPNNPNLTPAQRASLGLSSRIARTDLSSSLLLQLSDSTFSLSVDSGTAYEFPVGGYVRINGNSYRVESVDDPQTVTLTAVPALSAPRTISNDTEVFAVIIGATQGYNSSTPNTIYPTDTRSFLVGDTIYVGGFAARITTIDTDGSIVVTWQGSPQPNAINGFAEGAVITKDYFGATSNTNITTNGGGTISNGSESNSTRVSNPFRSSDTLFEQTFGMTYVEFETAYAPQAGGGLSMPLSGVTHYRGSIVLSGSSAICGSGILVVDGDLTINGSCDATGRGFEGIIYVRGKYSQQGNSAITGAVVAEGPSEFPNSSGNTSVAGTGQGNSKLVFDPKVLYQQGSLLSPWDFQTVAGTWRQR